ncbi:MarR family winged helix-turn-helix transcriptional regulator [Sphingomonas pituitosa]|uniref:MarR family winged helix-turn-helix transcriptional regulator n=1 Tax=Sphingomonas pituitosa TaxID=99597 RepID=UPI00083000BB|nr:MarR family transcriptional regulator [Sphingomonas pituitosa]
MPAPLPLDGQLCFSLYSASMAITRVYKPILDRLGITYPQYLVLHALWEKDGRTVGAIGERLALESSTITPLVKRLEAAGMLARKRNPEDERQVQVFLTDQGRTIREECGCLGEAVLEKTDLTLERLATLNREAQALRDSLARA